MKRMNPRAIIYQGVVVLLLAALFIFIAYNYTQNISRRNIGIGFGFLKDTAGFSISQTLIEYNESDTFGKIFVIGLLNTLLASFIGIVLATFLGFVFGLMRISSNKLVGGIAKSYVELMRNIPPLLHVIFWYQVVFLNILPPFKESIIFGNWMFINVRGITIPEFIMQSNGSTFNIILFLSIVLILLTIKVKKELALRGVHRRLWPWILGFILVPILYFIFANPYLMVLPEITKFRFATGMTIRPELFSIVIALSTYTSSYISEIVRSSISGVPKGQVEAAKSLGFNPWDRIRLIIVPQAMRTMVPPVTNQYLNLIKNTSLGMAIAYPDLTAVFAGTTLNQTGRALEVMALVMITYLGLSLITSFFMNWYNKSIIEKKGEILQKEDIPIE